MSHRFQNISLAFSLLASFYILVFLVPAQVNGGYTFTLQRRGYTTPLAGENEAAPIILPKFVQVKASGEEAIVDTESLSDQSLELFMKAREEFKTRFGDPLDDVAYVRPVHETFPVPENIREMVDYWESVFGTYSEDQYIFSHAEDVSIVYGVLDMGGLSADMFGMNEAELERFKQQVFGEEKARIRAKLTSLAQKMKDGATLSTEERRLARVFARDTDVSLEDAAKPENIRIQEGWSHRFKQAIVNSGQYMGQMERIFASKGLPVELTRIPFVESAFNIRALSSAGARGLWQFIDSTGRMYLKMDGLVDERLDPILSTYAAAEHLKNDYADLKSWPLAINAYNTGAGRMMKAQKQLGTNDIGQIIRKFDDPSYQFFSRNYYPEVVAAMNVYDNQERYFGTIQKLPPLRYELFMAPQSVNLHELASRLDISNEVMAKLNPALIPQVLEGTQSLPKGYLVKVPNGTGKLFSMASMELERQNNENRWHMVNAGETVQSVAALYGVSVKDIENANHLLSGEVVKSGALLTIPRRTDLAYQPEEDEEEPVNEGDTESDGETEDESEGQPDEINLN